MRLRARGLQPGLLSALLGAAFMSTSSMALAVVAQPPAAIDACALLSTSTIAQVLNVSVEAGTPHDAGLESNGAYSSACVWSVVTPPGFHDNPNAPLGGRSFVIVNAWRWPHGSDGARNYLDEFRRASERGELDAAPTTRRMGDEALWWGDGLAVRRGDVSFGISVFSSRVLPMAAQPITDGAGAREGRLARFILERLAADDGRALSGAKR